MSVTSFQLFVVAVFVVAYFLLSSVCHSRNEGTRQMSIEVCFSMSECGVQSFTI